MDSLDAEQSASKWTAEFLLKMESKNEDLPLWRFNSMRGSFVIPFRTEKYRKWVS